MWSKQPGCLRNNEMYVLSLLAQAAGFKMHVNVLNKNELQ